jgi:polyisoprenoid-binding protein YceI
MLGTEFRTAKFEAVGIGNHVLLEEFKVKKLIIAGLLLTTAAGAWAQSASKIFYANDDKKKDVVMFTSKAPLETIVGKTADIVGMVDVDPANVASAKARFEVDLASLKTGIDMRDTHMREQYLEVAKYPKAIFELTKVIKSSANILEDSKPVELTAEGNFTVHGVTKAVTIPMTVTYFKESEGTQSRLPGDIIHVEAGWDLLLSEYSIKRPQFIILKLDDKQAIEIDVFASTGTPAPQLGETIEKK